MARSREGAASVGGVLQAARAMKVLVTGATGRLGTVVCRELAGLGHDVLATDQRFAALGVPLKLADLRDPLVAYPLLEGRDALVHLGNVPNVSMGPSPQAVLGDNTRINANVFRAAVDLGVGRIVFASSLQAMIRLDDGRPCAPPYTIPYFPLDGDAPPNPGDNLYALSKELGERMLQLFCQLEQRLTATSLRFPMLAGDWFRKRLEAPLPPSALNLAEALTYLSFEDAAALVGLVLAHQKPGYHQYFPAQAIEAEGISPGALIAEHFPTTPLRRPAEQIRSLVDLSALERDVGFRPSPPLTVRLERR
jgi:nucleoside-diphosphate-sugar epimerase